MINIQINLRLGLVTRMYISLFVFEQDVMQHVLSISSLTSLRTTSQLIGKLNVHWRRLIQRHVKVCVHVLSDII